MIHGIAYCGNNCSVCPRYAATLSESGSLLQKVAAWWQQLGWRNQLDDPAEIKCQGCNLNTPCPHQITSCRNLAEHEHCLLCAEQKCPLLQEAYKKSALNAVKSRLISSPKDYQILKLAFFSKQKNIEKLKKQSHELDS